MTTFGTRRAGHSIVITDQGSHESMIPYFPCVFADDFLGDAIDARWTSLDVSSGGDTTPLIAADVANGVARCPLDVTDEAQVSGLTWGDQRPLILNQGLIWEARVALSTLPTILAEAVWGLAGDHNAVFDTVAEGIWFKADGNGAIVAEYDDTSHTADDVATGVTLTAGLFALFRIDCTDISDVHLYINGERVVGSTTIDMSQVAGLKLQPYFAIAKASGAGLGVLDVDVVRVFQRRAA
jgi:hypothetical protein